MYINVKRPRPCMCVSVECLPGSVIFTYLNIFKNRIYAHSGIPLLASEIIEIRHVADQEEIDGLVQERRTSSALAMELGLSCTNPSRYRPDLGQPGNRIVLYASFSLEMPVCNSK